MVRRQLVGRKDPKESSSRTGGVEVALGRQFSVLGSHVEEEADVEFEGMLPVMVIFKYPGMGTAITVGVGTIMLDQPERKEWVVSR